MGSKGGLARAAKLTPEQRSKIARQAALARWCSRTKKLKPLDAACLAALRILLERSKTHRTGYGYLQTADLVAVGLIQGDPSQWELTPLAEQLMQDQ